MQNKKLVFYSLIIVFVIFIGIVIFYKNEVQSKNLSSISNINEILVRDYSMKYGENGKNIYIVEFLDPQCESCALFNEITKKLYNEHYKDIQIVIKYLANHKDSKFAIKILEASREQNRYNEVLNMMYEKLDLWGGNANNKSNPQILWKFLANIPNLDIEKLKNDMNNSKIDEIIATDTNDAKKLQVRGTPTVFINGVELKTLSSKGLFDLVETEIYK